MAIRREFLPAQLGFGEKVVAEKTIKKGVAPKGCFAVVSTGRGYRNGKLSRDTNVEQTEYEIQGLSAWKVLESTKAEGYNDGVVIAIPGGRFIGLYASSVKSIINEVQPVIKKATH